MFYCILILLTAKQAHSFQLLKVYLMFREMGFSYLQYICNYFAVLNFDMYSH